MIAGYFIAAAVALVIIVIVIGSLFGWVYTIPIAIIGLGGEFVAYYVLYGKQNLNQAFEKINQPQRYTQNRTYDNPLEEPPIPPEIKNMSPDAIKKANDEYDKKMNELYDVPLKEPPIQLETNNMTLEDRKRVEKEYDEEVKKFLRGYEQPIEWERDQSEHYKRDKKREQEDVKSNSEVKFKVPHYFEKQAQLAEVQQAWRTNVITFLKDTRNARYKQFNTHEIK